MGDAPSMGALDHCGRRSRSSRYDGNTLKVELRQCAHYGTEPDCPLRGGASKVGGSICSKARGRGLQRALVLERVTTCLPEPEMILFRHVVKLTESPDQIACLSFSGANSRVRLKMVRDPAHENIGRIINVEADRVGKAERRAVVFVFSEQR